MAIDGKISTSISLVHASAYDFGGRYAEIKQALDLLFESGTGNNQADLVFSGQRTLAASASESFDLNGTTLLDAFGTAIAMAKIKAIYLKAAAGNTNNVIIGNVTNGIVGPFGAATHSILVKPGGVFLWACPGTGETITAGTGDLLKIANSGGTTGVTYDLMLLGTSV